LNHALALNDESDLAEIAKAAKTLSETERALRAKPARGDERSSGAEPATQDHAATSVVTSLLGKTTPHAA
jgi:hypothetical protein